MKKYLAEMVGTMVLTLLGCGTAVSLNCGADTASAAPQRNAMQPNRNRNSLIFTAVLSAASDKKRAASPTCRTQRLTTAQSSRQAGCRISTQRYNATHPYVRQMILKVVISE